MVVLPALVDTDRVACPPSFSTLLKIFNKLASSSPIFSSQNLEKKNGRGRKSSSLWQGQLGCFAAPLLLIDGSAIYRENAHSARERERNRFTFLSLPGVQYSGSTIPTNANCKAFSFVTQNNFQKRNHLKVISCPEVFRLN